MEINFMGKSGYMPSDSRAVPYYQLGTKFDGCGDKLTAALYFRRSAINRQAPAQRALAMLYIDNAELFEQDTIKQKARCAIGVYWLKRAAAQGDRKAKDKIDKMRRIGDKRLDFAKDNIIGLGLDEIEKNWAALGDFCLTIEAALGGDAKACAAVGFFYAAFLPNEEAQAAAFQWLYLAARSGCADAQFACGAAHLLGFGGLAKDENDARQWLEKAKEQGCERAAELITAWDEPGPVVDEFFLRYWKEFLEYVTRRTKYKTVANRAEPSDTNKRRFASCGKLGIIYLILKPQKGKQVKVELQIKGGKVLYDYLFKNKAAIEKSIGHRLKWERNEEKGTYRINISKKAEHFDEESRHAQILWLAKTGLSFYETFQSYN